MENCHGSKVVARIAHICNERNDIMDNFENDVAYLLPICPVKEKIRGARKRRQISSLTENIRGGLNEDSHDGNVASAKISSGEEVSCEEESNEIKELSDDERSGSDSEYDASDDEITRIIRKGVE